MESDGTRREIVGKRRCVVGGRVRGSQSQRDLFWADTENCGTSFEFHCRIPCGNGLLPHQRLASTGGPVISADSHAGHKDRGGGRTIDAAVSLSPIKRDPEGSFDTLG